MRRLLLLKKMLPAGGKGSFGKNPNAPLLCPLQSVILSDIQMRTKTDMTEKNMRKFKKIIAAFLALALSALLLASCNNEEEKAVAVYDGDKYIYEDDADFSDFYNLNRYFHAYESGDEAESKSEYNTILSAAVKQTVVLRLAEEKMGVHGTTIDMQKVNQAAASDEATFESTYQGGFEKFCSDWGLSENVFVLYYKYEAIKDMEKNLIEVNVTDAEAEKYYRQNPDKYFKTPHYDVNTLFLQVIDPSNEDKMDEAYDDALIYMQMLNSGRTWDSVKTTALKKYNSGSGLMFSEHLSRLNHVSMQYFFEVENLEEALAERNKEFFDENGMSFKEMFPNCFEAYVAENSLMGGTKEFNEALEKYMKYATDVYNIEFNYAITNFWEKGKTYEKPIYHHAYNSYVLLTFTGIEEENVTIDFEDAKESIIEILTEDKKEKEVEDHISQEMNDLKVRIYYK